MNARQRAEFKRRRTVAIKKLREAGMSEAEIQAELAKLREERVNDSTEHGLSEVEAMEEPTLYLPAVISREPDEPTEQNGRDWSNYAVPERRCIRIKRNGEQCKNAAIKGSTVCMYHGGAAKHVRESARARIENATDRLAKELLGMAIDPGMTPQVKLAAIRDALDRGGLKPPTTVEVGPTKPHEEVFADLVGGSRAESRAQRGLIDGLDESSDLIASGQISRHDDSGGDPISPPTPPPATWADSERDPLSAPLPRDRSSARASDRPARPERSQGQPAVTGEDAIRLANQANGLIDPDVFGLPPGRSSYYE